MPETWTTALTQYNYPVDLTLYRDARAFPNFFTRRIQGDRCSTMLFEDYFRANRQNVETWYEVIFWKMYSQTGRRDQRTADIMDDMNSDPVITANQLDTAVTTFINDANRHNFTNFRRLFRSESLAIAIPATFPASIDPVHFPMVDTRVAKWTNSQLNSHNENDSTGPQLTRSCYPQNGSTVWK